MKDEGNISVNNFEKKKENKLGLIILCISILICVISVSYAIWTQVYEGKKVNKISTATLDLKFQNEENNVNIENGIPTADINGKKSVPYEFELKNSGTTSARYQLSLVEDNDSYVADGCTNNKMELSNIKYILTSPKQSVDSINILNPTSSVLYEDTISPGEVQKFTLRLWIKSEADTSVMGKHFHGKVQVDAIQSDKSFND